MAQHGVHVHSSVSMVTPVDHMDLKSEAVMCFQGGVCRRRRDVQRNRARAGDPDAGGQRRGPRPARRRPGAMSVAHRDHPRR